ncbi:asparagine synthase (glutamine-hydrolyzing) [Thermodesulfobacteriota bacterium]
MCGIFGEFSISNKVDIQKGQQRLQMLAHRGPDGFGMAYGIYGKRYQLRHNKYIDPGQDLYYDYFIGHQRLSIIDLSDSALQPMESRDRRYLVVFNGEIYNYPELKSELLARGHDFRTDHSDTEILLEAFLEWGESCLDRLIGMFAFAVFDVLENRIFIARDRIGQKPLYYALTNGKFIFASELRSIVRDEVNSFEIDREALAQYLAFGYIPHPLSPFEKIKKLPPAHFGWVSLSTGSIHLNPYWTLPQHDERQDVSPEEWKERLSFLLTDSVRLRLRSDVPVGIFSSGGVDSTIVTKKVSEMKGDAIQSFGAYFSPTRSRGKKVIEEVSRKYDTHLYLKLFNVKQAAGFEEIISVFDEPFDGGSAVPTFHLFGMAKARKIKVILTGDGGDELFAGYKRYQDYLILAYIKRFIKALPVFRTPFLSFSKHLGIKPKTLAMLKTISGKDSILQYFHSFHKPDLALLLRGQDTHTDFYDSLVPQDVHDEIRLIQYLDTQYILPGRMLYRLDRFSMHHGIEARSPFMDHRICELAFQIPTKYKVNLRYKKKILKDLLNSDFNRRFIHQPKTGFGNPLPSWFGNTDLKEHMITGLKDSSHIMFRYIDFDRFSTMLNEIAEKNLFVRECQVLWRFVVLSFFLDSNRTCIK